MDGALTSVPVSLELLKVVVSGIAMSSEGVKPRVVRAEEPDGGNLQVRIWRGPGLGNWPRLLYKQAEISAIGARPVVVTA